MFFYFSNKKGASVFSFASIIIGLLFFLIPNITTSLITNTIGILFLIQGIGALITYISALRNGMASIFMAISAFILLALGVFVLTNHQTVMSIIPVIVGVFILFSGINATQKSFALKNLGDKNWSRSLISAIIKLLLAAILLFNPFSSAILMIRVIGLSLIVESLSSFFTARKYKKFMQDDGSIMDNIVIKRQFNSEKNIDGTIDVNYKDVE